MPPSLPPWTRNLSCRGNDDHDVATSATDDDDDRHRQTVIPDAKAIFPHERHRPRGIVVTMVDDDDGRALRVPEGNVLAAAERIPASESRRNDGVGATASGGVDEADEEIEKDGDRDSQSDQSEQSDSQEPEREQQPERQQEQEQEQEEEDQHERPHLPQQPEVDLELGATLPGDKERLPPTPIDPTLPITPSRIVTLKKRGQRFLCICDMRRAVILLNAAAIFASASALLVFLLHELNIVGRDPDSMEGEITNGDEFFSRTNLDYDPFWTDDLPRYLPSFWIAVGQGRFGRMVAYLMTVCTICYASLGAYGAARYNVVMVFGAACWPFVHAFVGAAHRDYAGMTVAIVAVYPHVALMYELYHKIMTPFHYEASEDYCLCRHPRQRKLPMGDDEGRLQAQAPETAGDE